MDAGKKIGLVLAIALGVISLPLASNAASEDPGIVGAWSAPLDSGIIGIHASLLRTGKVLLYEHPQNNAGSDAALFDPQGLTTTEVDLPLQRDAFCSGFTFMPDGRLLISGGTVYGSPAADGIKDVTIFDPATNSWSSAANMGQARWYPTSVTLGDGKPITFAGFVHDGDISQSMELYDPAKDSWATFPSSADSDSPPYTRVSLLPSGKIFRSAPEAEGELFDPATGSWSFVSDMSFGDRYGGAAVLLPGLQKVLVAGGNEYPNSNPGTPTAEVIDLSSPSPHWTSTGSMNRARTDLNLTLLPDGKVLAVGGGTYHPYTGPEHEAEMYDPATGQWTLMAAQQADRMYHSSALLLPDGRVMSAGSDGGNSPWSIELYSPPYLFHGARPAISGAPSAVSYGQSFNVSISGASGISSVVLMRPGAVTHGNNFDQRYVGLTFRKKGSGRLEVAAPSGGNIAPPGYYLLFVLNANGVPSMARFVRLH